MARPVPGPAAARLLAPSSQRQPASMKTTRLPGLHFWSVYQPDRRIDFNGFFLEGVAGGVAIDPMPLAVEQVEFVRARGGLRWILLTNADHWRASAELKRAFGARLCAPADERERLGPRAAEVTDWFGPQTALPRELADLFEVHWLAGGKSPQEAVFVWRERQAVFFGDAVRSHETGTLRLLPPEKLSEPARLHKDLRPLLTRPFEAVLLGDGDNLLQGAALALTNLAQRLGP
jgi:glyoxylase-like metal-dependent hydrolase (beta-lactamase superfamily II)